jgi:AraC-like DNA-binding protein
MGERESLSVLGLVGRMAENSVDVGAALRNLSAYLHVHDRGAVLTLTVSRGVATLGYAIYAGDVPGLPQIYDGAIAIACNVMRALCGARWRPDEVLIQRTAPRSAVPYRTFFKSPVRFDADQTALVFPARVLEQKIERADAALLRVVSANVEALDARADVDLPQRLRRVLRGVLMSGRGSRDEVARVVAMHRRTLNRRLEAHGTTFHALADEVRYEIARQLLRDTRMPLAQIAATFDYADASAFTRAFRRWSGIAPSAWRAENTGAD